MPIVTAAIMAAYYSITDPATKSDQVVSSNESSSDVIQKAWGMVSLSAIKQLSLQASKIIKGAAIAERVNIANVPCFVLSRHPFPALSAALKRYRRQQEREPSNLSTILEQGTSTNDNDDHHLFYPQQQQQQPVVNLQSYPKKNVIFHLTGGGFFAHTIAGDLPYLLDWSSATDAVVICPEYALLPEHPFPTAIEEITALYCSILSGMTTAPMLGFRVDHIIVTGESAGGNLATALCVKLCLDQIVDVEALASQERQQRQQQEEEKEKQKHHQHEQSTQEHDDDDDDDELNTNNGSSDIDRSSSPPSGESHCEVNGNKSGIRLPDGLMVSCPALNLCLDIITPSRIMGFKDPVLPSGLISAISNAYVPPPTPQSSSSSSSSSNHNNINNNNNNKTNPIVSPYYAPDDILRWFPPTLIYASSDDPLLDDSVDFNTRLSRLGVSSELRAVHNMPHAYWGLGTAGFPEAKLVQRECQEWLVHRFQK